jgi:hypothetical protein
MQYNKIIKIEFLKPGRNLYLNPDLLFTVKEIEIEFDDLLSLIQEVEINKLGFGKNLHREAFTGIDYLGNSVQFSSYVIWQDDGKIFKFNFNSDWIPFDAEIIKRKRDNNIDSII